MRTGSIGTTTTLATLAVLLLGCDIGARTRVETLCSTGPSGYCQSPVTSIALDATTIYWTEETTVEERHHLDDQVGAQEGAPPGPPSRSSAPGSSSPPRQARSGLPSRLAWSRVEILSTGW